MGKILPEDEIEQLIKGLTMDLENSLPLEGRDIQTGELREYFKYDILKTDRFIRGRLPGLEIISDTFSSELSKQLSRALKKNIEINPISIDIVNFESYIKSLSAPIHIDQFMDNYLNYFYLVLDDHCRKNYSNLLLNKDYTDIFKSKDQIENDIDFLDLEEYLLYLISKKTTQCLNYSFSKIIPNWKCKYFDKVDHPRYLIHFSSENIIIISFEVDLSGEMGSITLIIPYTFVHPFKEYLKASNIFKYRPNLYTDEVTKQYVYDKVINNTYMNYNLKFVVELTIKELVNLHVGQEIPLTDRHIYMEDSLDHINLLTLVPLEEPYSFSVIDIHQPSTELHVEESENYKTIPEFIVDPPDLTKVPADTVNIINRLKRSL